LLRRQGPPTNDIGDCFVAGVLLAATVLIVKCE
jgi:hypothetical protein